MKVFVLSLILVFTTTFNGQIGVNTINPEVTLDIRVLDPNSPDSSSGLAIPLVNSLASNTNRNGQMVYKAGEGPYYYTGSQWNSLIHDFNSYQPGDIKNDLSTIDHNGWVLLDGRPLTSLTASQKAQAENLGILVNLPDATNKVLKLASGGGSMLSEGGQNNLTLLKANMPSFTMTGGTTFTDGQHVHTYTERHGNNLNNTEGTGGKRRLVGVITNTDSTSSDLNAHNHSINVNSGGSDTAIRVQDMYLTMNVFIYLGL